MRAMVGRSGNNLPELTIPGAYKLSQQGERPMKTWSRILVTMLWLGVILQANTGAAVVLGQIDTFQDPHADELDAGLGAPSPPSRPWLFPMAVPWAPVTLYATHRVGGTGPGSKIAVVNRDAQWAGNYLALGVNAITMMSLKNTGATDLVVRS